MGYYMVLLNRVWPVLLIDTDGSVNLRMALSRANLPANPFEEPGWPGMDALGFGIRSPMGCHRMSRKLIFTSRWCNVILEHFETWIVDDSPACILQ